MRVYRVEHADTTLGPYSGEDRIDDMAVAHTNADHPCPWEDTTPVRNFIRRHAWQDYAIHGLDSLENVYKWFAGWEDKLAAGNFVIRVYEVPLGSYRRGKQVVFRKDRARRVETLKIQKNF